MRALAVVNCRPADCLDDLQSDETVGEGLAVNLMSSSGKVGTR
jgi:hypothetical protein